MIKYIVVKKFLPGLDCNPFSNIFRNRFQSEIFPEFSSQSQRMGPDPFVVPGHTAAGIAANSRCGYLPGKMDEEDGGWGSSRWCNRTIVALNSSSSRRPGCCFRNFFAEEYSSTELQLGVLSASLQAAAAADATGPAAGRRPSDRSIIRRSLWWDLVVARVVGFRSASARRPRGRVPRGNCRYLTPGKSSAVVNFVP